MASDNIIRVEGFYRDFKEFSIEIIANVNIFQKLPGAISPGTPFFVRIPRLMYVNLSLTKYF